MTLQQLKMMAGVGLFIRAYHTRHDLLTDSINTAVSLIETGRDDVDALAVAVVECFPDGRLTRHDPVQQLAIRILNNFMITAHTVGLREALETYNEGVNNALDTLEISPAWISQKAVYTFLDRSESQFDAQYPINHTKHSSVSIEESISINRYLSDSVEHFHLG